MTDQNVEFPQLNDPKVAEKVKKSLQDISNLFTVRDGYNSTIKAAIAGVAEEHDVPKKLVRQLARSYHRQTFQTEVQEKEVFEITYEKVFGVDG